MTLLQPYNLSISGKNTTAVVALMQTVNDNLMFGYFGLFGLMAIFSISMIVSFVVTAGSASKSFMVSSFGVWIFSILFWLMGIVNDLTMWTCLALFGISLALIKK